ncbi:MAG TPA: transglutaminase-like domain-containing protein [Pirellulales bacterium]|jgi:regulator of sirC expression with transglutaminase-like and TPR domain|nr:transglutaminase-like domain-containing protein [Pirellulales bacterium]
MSQAPRYCRSAAYELFARELPSLEETSSLVRAAIAVSMHELDGVDTAAVEQTLAEIAQEICSRVCSGNPQAMIAQLHEVLFEEWGFAGHAENYYALENSYLPRVLETRRGIPVTLSLVYKAVAQQVGLKVRGINSPIHFLAAVEVGNSWMIVDAFDRGRVLTDNEVYHLLDQRAGTPVERSDAVLATATHPQWLARIIHNLEQIFSRAGRQSDVLAMQELLALVQHAD